MYFSSVLIVSRITVEANLLHEIKDRISLSLTSKFAFT